MENKHKKIIDLVNASLNNKKFDQELTMEDYHLIRDNQLIGLVFNALNKDIIDESVYKLLKSDYFQYIRTDEIQKQMIEELRNIFNQNKIDFVFLKGSFLKTIYPGSHMRAMGDIDILVKEEKMKDIHLLLENNGFKCWSQSAAHDCFMKQKVNIEIHPQLDSNIEGQYQDLFSNPWKHTFHFKGNEYWLSHEYNFFYQVYHMIKHLYRSGVGYRTLVDLKLYLDTFEGEMNQDKFMEIYQVFPKQKFIDFIILLINDLFNSNLLNEHVGKNKEFTRNYNEVFIDYLFISGAHGIGETHNLFVGDMAIKNKKHRWMILTKIEFLFKRTFLGFKQMKGIYLYLHKYPFLLPVAWIQRFFKLLFNKRARQKLKRLHINKEDVVKVEDLFNHIGI